MRRLGFARSVGLVVMGGAAGFAALALLLAAASLLPPRPHQAFLEGLALLAQPIALLFSAISGWPLQQEAAWMLYGLAIPATFVLTGMVGGWAVPWLRR